MEGKFGLFSEDLIVGLYAKALEIPGCLDDSQHSGNAVLW